MAGRAESPIKVDGFLADSVARAEGKLYVQGAGWNQIRASLFPAVHDRIGIGLIFTVQPEGQIGTHRFELRLEDSSGVEVPLGTAPSGDRMFRLSGEFSTAPQTPGAGAEQLVAVAINLNGMSFERPARYRFVISVDGADAKALAFEVQSLASAEGPSTTSAGYL
jgi:hypothetical protein